MTGGPADLAATRIAAPADAVFALLSDPARLSEWSFGTWETVLHPGGVIEGRAIVTSATIWLRIDADPGRLLVDYHLGPDAGSLQPRIFARVVPGPVTRHGEGTCTLLLCGLRTAEMDDDRWQRLCRAHGFEADLIRTIAEHAARG